MTGRIIHFAAIIVFCVAPMASVLVPIWFEVIAFCWACMIAIGLVSAFAETVSELYS